MFNLEHDAKQSNARKFMTEHNRFLINMVPLYIKKGRTSWSNLAKIFNKRFPDHIKSSDQLKRHYDNINPQLSKLPFTNDEINFIKNAKNENKTENWIGKQLGHPINQIKNFCNRKLKKQNDFENEQDLKLDEINEDDFINRPKFDEIIDFINWSNFGENKEMILKSEE